jgi:uncharacterized repeat protein (TIGR01451 family)
MGATSNTAPITVIGQPTIQKSFSTATICTGGVATLTFTITNPNSATAFTGISFTDSLPSGLVVAPTPNAGTTCGTGSFNPAPVSGDTSLSFSGGMLAANTNCTVHVDVTGTTTGIKNNTSGPVSSTEGGTGGTSNQATITVVAPPVAVADTFATQKNTPLNQPAPGVLANDTLNGASIFSYGTPTGGEQTTIGASTATSGGGTVSLNANGSFSYTPASGFTGMDTFKYVLKSPGGCTSTATVTINVAAAPTLMKAFGALSIPLGGTTTLTFSITNPNSAQGLTGIAFTDMLPAGLTVATSGPTATCGGMVTTTSPNMISFGAGSLAASGNCSFFVTVTGTTAGVWSNTTGAISSNESGTGATSNTAMITVVAPPTISKAFTASTICTNGVSTLTFSITNPNTTTTLTGIAFTDTLPAGVQVAATPNANTNCTGGSFTPAAGDTTLNFSSGSLTAGSNCTVSVDVTGTTAGTKNNVSGSISSTEGGTGLTANATLTVLAPPVAVADTFATLPNTPLNQPAPGVLANDTLNSASIFSYGTPTGTEQTTIGAATPTSGGGSVSLNANGSFSYTPAAGFHGSDTFKYVLKSPGGCTSTATVTINVATPPTLMKSFNPSSILLGQTSTLTFSITNPNSAQGLTGITFTDTLPAGITVPTAAPTAACGGMVSTTAPNLISFSGGSLAASGSCMFSVTVTGATTGVWNNTSGNISSNESGAGGTSNQATLTVVGPPSIMKSFDAATIPLNGTSVLTFTITNPNTTTAFTGVAFTDTLPAGLTVPTGSSAVCGGGTLTTTAPNMIALTGGAIAASGNCSFTVTVTGTTAGVKNNTTGTVSAANGGTGGSSNTATITVLAPPTIAKSFGAPNIPLNGTTSLTFTVTNPNSTVGLTGVSFTDTLPAGLTTPNNAGSSQCGGTLTVTGTNQIVLSGATVPQGANCTFSVTVTGTTGGVKNNVTTPASSTNGGTGTTGGMASLTVATAPTIMKSFGAATIPLGGTTSLTFTITNTNASLGITGISFTDTLPAGLTVANGSSAACGGGTVTTSGGNLISFSGGSLAGGGSCTFSVTVTGTAAGPQSNTTGNISSNETGPGATSNTAQITVVAPPTIVKAFGGPTVPLHGTTTLSFTITNPNSTVALTGVTVTDTLPFPGLTVATGSSSGCGGGTVTTTAPSTITLTGGTIPAGGNCIFMVTVTGMTPGLKNNTTGNVSSANGGTGTTSNTAQITVVVPPTITKAFGASFVPVGQTTTLSFTLTNPNPTVTVTGVGFTDPFPSGLVVANPPNATDTCGGTFAPMAGDTSLTFTGGTIPAGGTCVLTVKVQVTSGGSKTNTTSAITSNEGGTGGGSNTVTIVTFDKCLKDDTTGNFIQFSSMTGDYRFVQCTGGNATLMGTGTLTVNGNVISITDLNKPDRRVSISYFSNTTTGTAAVTIIFAPGVSQTFSIRDTQPNATCACGP